MARTSESTAGPERLRLVAYVRVSTARQAEEGLGLTVQRKALTAWVKRHGHRIVLWTADEGRSGSNGVESREGLYEALEALRDGSAAGLVTYNLDRLARRLEVQEGILGQVWAAGRNVFTVEDGEVRQDDPDDPMRTAMRQMRGVFSQLERSMIAKRMRDGRRVKAEGGGFAYGSPPFGFRAEGRTLVPEDQEQAAVRLIGQLRQEGKSYREIAARLTTEGHKPKRADTWHAATVRLIERREAAR